MRIGNMIVNVLLQSTRLVNAGDLRHIFDHIEETGSAVKVVAWAVLSGFVLAPIFAYSSHNVNNMPTTCSI